MVGDSGSSLFGCTVLPGGCIIILILWQFHGSKTNLLSFTNLAITEDSDELLS